MVLTQRIYKKLYVIPEEDYKRKRKYQKKKIARQNNIMNQSFSPENKIIINNNDCGPSKDSSDKQRKNYKKNNRVKKGSIQKLLNASKQHFLKQLSEIIRDNNMDISMNHITKFLSTPRIRSTIMNEITEGLKNENTVPDEEFIKLIHNSIHDQLKEHFDNLINKGNANRDHINTISREIMDKLNNMSSTITDEIKKNLSISPNESLQEELRKTRNELISTQRHKENIETELRKSKFNEQEIKSKLDSANTLANSLNQKLNLTENQHQIVKRQLENNIQNLTNNLNKETEWKSFAENLNKELKLTIEQKEKLIHSLNDIKNDLSRQLQESNLRERDIERQKDLTISEKEQIIKNLQTEKLKLVEDIESARNRSNPFATEEGNRLRQQLEESQKIISNIQQNLNLSHAENEKLKHVFENKMQSLQSSLDNESNLRKAGEEAIKSLNLDLTDKMYSLKILNQTVDKLAKEKEDFKKALDESKEGVDNRENLIQEWQKKLDEEINRKDDLNLALTEKDDLITALRKRLEERENEQTDVSSLKNELEGIKTNTIPSLSAEKENYKKQLEEMKSLNSDAVQKWTNKLRDEINAREDLDQQISVLQNELKEKDELIKRKMKEEISGDRPINIVQQYPERDTLKREYNETKKKLEREINDLHKLLRTEREKNSSLQNQLEKNNKPSIPTHPLEENDLPVLYYEPSPDPEPQVDSSNMEHRKIRTRTLSDSENVIKKKLKKPMKRSTKNLPFNIVDIKRHLGVPSRKPPQREAKDTANTKLAVGGTITKRKRKMARQLPPPEHPALRREMGRRDVMPSREELLNQILMERRDNDKKRRRLNPKRIRRQSL